MALIDAGTREADPEEVAGLIDRLAELGFAPTVFDGDLHDQDVTDYWLEPVVGLD